MTEDNKIRRRNTWITIFVIFWIILFYYESSRHFLLERWFHTDLPKMKFLFPPAGWIMFYSVEDAYSFAEVYGYKVGIPVKIDPHDILETKGILYDNIHRNVLSLVLYPDMQPKFCRFLERKLPEYDRFAIVAVYYPSLTQTPDKALRRIMYTCP